MEKKESYNVAEKYSRWEIDPWLCLMHESTIMSKCGDIQQF